MDRTVVVRAQSGDREAFGQVADGASDRLYGLALRILRDSEAAGDVLQLTLVQIWRDLPSLHDPDRFDAWSYRVAVRQCHLYLRQARRRVGLATLSTADGTVGDVQLVVGQRDELERAFGRLTADQRAILVLTYYRELTVPEVASVLGISPGTVKSRLHYARAAMRAALEADARPATEGRPA